MHYNTQASPMGNISFNPRGGIGSENRRTFDPTSFYASRSEMRGRGSQDAVDNARSSYSARRASASNQPFIRDYGSRRGGEQQRYSRTSQSIMGEFDRAYEQTAGEGASQGLGNSLSEALTSVMNSNSNSGGTDNPMAATQSGSFMMSQMGQPAMSPHAFNNMKRYGSASGMNPTGGFSNFKNSFLNSSGSGAGAGGNSGMLNSAAMMGSSGGFGGGFGGFAGGGGGASAMGASRLASMFGR